MWDQGAAITYKLRFEEIVPIPPPITTTTTTKPTVTTTTAKIKKTTTTRRKINFILLKLFFNLFNLASTQPHTGGVKCRGINMYGFYWEDTPYGSTAQIDCPGTTSAQAIWLCGGNKSVPQWVTKTPDFSPCISDWIRNIEQQVFDHKHYLPLKYFIQCSPNLFIGNFVITVNLS